MTTQHQNDGMIHKKKKNCEEFVRKQLWPNLTHSPGTCMKELRKTKNLMTQ